MRSWAACLAAALLWTPIPAAAEDGARQYTGRQMCGRMTKQIDHFENTVLAMAKARGNTLWEQATNDHIDRLKNRRADKCPEYAKQRSALARAKAQADQMRQMMITAAKGAAKYFSGGWF